MSATVQDSRRFGYSIPVTNATNADSIDQSSCVCGAINGKPKFQIGNTPWSVVDCLNCGTGRLTPAPNQQQLSEFYEHSYYGREGSKFRLGVEFAVRLVARRRTRFLTRHFPSGGRVLDVGCGRGVLLNNLAELGYEAWGTEISAEACRGVDPSVNVRIADSLRLAELGESLFDGIVIWHVLEHLADPAETIREAWRLLKPGGRLIVSVPNYGSLQARLAGAAWFHLDPPRHLFHFTVPALNDLLCREQFSVCSTHHFSLRQNPFGWVQSALNRTGLFPRNALYTMLQAESAVQGGLVRRFIQRCAWLAGMPIGLTLSVLAALMQTGATVHVVAEKPVETRRSVRRIPR